MIEHDAVIVLTCNTSILNLSLYSKPLLLKSSAFRQTLLLRLSTLSTLFIYNKLNWYEKIPSTVIYINQNKQRSIERFLILLIQENSSGNS